MIFVTGGTGLLGSYLLRALVAQGKPVSALYRTAIPDTDYAKSVHWIKGDVLDTVILEEAMAQAQEVYHCAAIVSFNPARKYEMLKINAEGTANVVNAALRTGVRKLVHVGSVSALGRKKDGVPASEKDQWNEEDKNNSNYGRSKYFAELEVWRGISEGLSAVIINPSTILGVGDWNDGSSSLFKKVWEEFVWYTDGSGGFVDAEDVAKAMIGLMDSDITAEKFIVSAENLPFRSVFTSMAKAFGKKPPHRKAPSSVIRVLCMFEKWRSFFTGMEPLITRETARTARRKTMYDNSKLLQYLPGFTYKPLDQTITEYCAVYQSGQ
ncbi:MAG: NAD-dependent epimerase/dehydratase family protein [Chitinophagaceae bacterium]|nr:NAD-dependent epimerase/dehydratase family protein [Chitinophagaceae bacterium]